MKFREISDLHLYCDPLYRLPKTETEKEEVLLLAGDIDDNKNHRLKMFLEDCSNRFKEVVYISGNHEYWGTNIIRNHEKLQEICKQYENVHYLNNQVFSISGIDIIGCTLWSDLKPQEMSLSNLMNDYKRIRHGTKARPFDRKLTTFDTCTLHKESVDFIKNALANTTNKTIILTHHAPSFHSLDPRYAGELSNCFYATNLEGIIHEYRPDVWVHGHIHTFWDYSIENTRIICNPKGYDSALGKEITGYNDIFTFEL